MDKRVGNTSMVMLPWLAHGHISPFLELAKKLTHRNFIIYLCSTPINLNSIKNTVIDQNYSSSIQLVELHLPSLPELPPRYHTTNGLPPHLMDTLKDAFELSRPAFTNILTTIKPDLLLYDFNQPWAAAISSSHNIPAVQFLTGGAGMAAYGLHMIYKPGQDFPFPLLYPRFHKIGESVDFSKIPDNVKKDIDRFLEALRRSHDIILCKTFEEIEEKYIDYLSVLTNKKIIPVGPLVQETIKVDDEQHMEITQWLDNKEENSVVFVSFGSEYFLSNEEMEEVANGLELSEVNFIWVVRFPAGGKKIVLKEALPENFLKREGWWWRDGQRRRKYWGTKAQPLNARLVEEVGVGVEVVRDESRKLRREGLQR
ncbi:hypothetical protein LguiA_016718 [Lonicera macranthoides]